MFPAICWLAEPQRDASEPQTTDRGHIARRAAIEQILVWELSNILYDHQSHTLWIIL
jgi:hypothetical protein